MRHKLFIVLLSLILFASAGGNRQLFSKFSRPENVTYTTDRRSFFSQISRKFYGSSRFAEDLEEINKPLKNQILSPDQLDQLIIPDIETIKSYHGLRQKSKNSEKIYLNTKDQMVSIIISIISMMGLLIHLNQLFLPLVILMLCLFMIYRIAHWLFLKKRDYNNEIQLQKSNKSDDRILIEFDVTRWQKENEKIL